MLQISGRTQGRAGLGKRNREWRAELEGLPIRTGILTASKDMLPDGQTLRFMLCCSQKIRRVPISDRRKDSLWGQSRSMLRWMANHSPLKRASKLLDSSENLVFLRGEWVQLNRHAGWITFQILKTARAVFSARRALLEMKCFLICLRTLTH
jgi:hypothetical protein